MKMSEPVDALPNEEPLNEKMQKVNPSKILSEFFPNSCFICQTTGNLKRCSCCNMISYCGTEHQKEHWPEHKEFCREIWILKTEHAVSHLYQNLQGLDLETWNIQRDLLLEEVEERLGREVTFHELDVLMFPRVCFVCHEARQDELKNCPGCPAASFCNEHPSSPLHDADCHKVKKIHEMNMEADPAARLMLMEVIVPIITHLQVNKSSDLPDSMQEFLDRHAKPGMNFSENEMIFISDFCDKPLTVFNTLKKLNYSQSDIIIHIEGMGSTSKTIDTSKYWEVLFHLLPTLRKMKIVFVDVDSACRIGITLCQNCRSMNKLLSVETATLPYLEFIKKKEFEKPSIVVLFNLEVETIIDNDFLISLQLKLVRCSELNCPLVFTTNRKREHSLLKKILRSSLGNFNSCYEGLNKFGTLSYSRHWDGGLCLQNNFLIVINPEESKDSSPDCFYAAYCALCFSEDASEMCGRCRMIFYCGKAHRDEDLPCHEELCTVVSGMLDEYGIPNLFDELATPDPEEWLKVKIDLMLEVKKKLGRELMDYEKEIFLYPKTCFVCHESNLDLLRNCKCGVSLCKIHENDFRHEQLCQNLSLAFQLSIMESPLDLKGLMKAKPGIALPGSMEDFLDSFFQFQRRNEDSHKLILSNLHTRPLTFVYAVMKLNLMIDSLMVVHVIGATGMEVGTYANWTPVFFFLKRLQNLKVVFIGPKVFSKNNSLDNFLHESSCLVMEEETLQVECHSLRYEEYCRSDLFVQPNIILGYNLNLHESELGISDCTWKDTISMLEELEVPFVLTAGSEDRARKDHRRLCALLGKSVDYIYLGKNPFGGFIPERDFETEELLYSNQHVIIYDGFYENFEGKEESSESEFVECLIN